MTLVDDGLKKIKPHLVRCEEDLDEWIRSEVKRRRVSAAQVIRDCIREVKDRNSKNGGTT